MGLPLKTGILVSAQRGLLACLSQRCDRGERKDREESAHPEIGNNAYKRDKGTTPQHATHSVDEESSGATESHTHPGTAPPGLPAGGTHTQRQDIQVIPGMRAEHAHNQQSTG